MDALTLLTVLKLSAGVGTAVFGIYGLRTATDQQPDSRAKRVAMGGIVFCAAIACLINVVEHVQARRTQRSDQKEALLQATRDSVELLNSKRILNPIGNASIQYSLRYELASNVLGNYPERILAHLDSIKSRDGWDYHHHDPEQGLDFYRTGGSTEWVYIERNSPLLPSKEVDGVLAPATALTQFDFTVGIVQDTMPSRLRRFFGEYALDLLFADRDGASIRAVVDPTPLPELRDVQLYIDFKEGYLEKRVLVSVLSPSSNNSSLMSVFDLPGTTLRFEDMTTLSQDVQLTRFVVGFNGGARQIVIDPSKFEKRLEGRDPSWYHIFDAAELGLLGPVRRY